MAKKRVSGRKRKRTETDPDGDPPKTARMAALAKVRDALEKIKGFPRPIIFTYSLDNDIRPQLVVSDTWTIEAVTTKVEGIPYVYRVNQKMGETGRQLRCEVNDIGLLVYLLKREIVKKKPLSLVIQFPKGA